MKHTYVLILFLSYYISLFGSGSLKHTATFARKDIFQTAYFIKNIPGLITDYGDQHIRYFASHDGLTVFLTDAGPIYKLSQPAEKQKGRDLEIISSFTSVKWVGANPHPRIDAIEKGTGYYTFLIGTNDRGLNSIVTNGYKKVVYHDIYPGIDVEYSFPEKGGLKYNLIVHSGADPSRIQMIYDSGTDNLPTDKDGNIVIHTATGDIIEHIPASFANGQSVPTSYELQGEMISFSLPTGYDHNQTLVIDPWVTVISTLTANELGVSVDYDTAGNLYAYGGGGANSIDLRDYHKVAKYDANGNFLWVFGGSIPLAGWNTVGNSPRNYLSNIKVDRMTNKIYVGQALNNSGVQAIRLTSAGAYDNFISTADTAITQISSFVSNCSTGSLLLMGGSAFSNQSIGFIDTVSGMVTSSNITQLNTFAQDIVSATYDTYGDLYVIMASYNNISNVNNVMFRANASYNGYVWRTPSGFNSFVQSQNIPAFGTIYSSSNNFNGFAANGSYLYYYDGYNLKAFDFSSGSTVGTPTSINGYNPLWQGGIAVDNCNHIYLGGQGVIKTFTFDGNTFTANADIPLGSGFSDDTILDVRYNSSNNLLYVTGPNIVGTYVAPLSDTCPVATMNNAFATTVTLSCNEAFIQVTPITALNNPLFSFLWEDSNGNIIRQTLPDTTLSDTLIVMNAGKYTVQIQLNLNCGGSVRIDTINILSTPTILTQNALICSGQGYMFYGHNIDSPGTYSDTLSSVFGCDTIMTLNLSIYPSSQSEIKTTICPGQVYMFNGHAYDSAGIYKDTLSSINGCDSIATLVLSFRRLPEVGFVQADTIIDHCNSILQLTGGSPYGGYYSGPYVSGDSIINPPGDTTFDVTYFYTDTSGCINSASLRFHTLICTGVSDISDASGIRLYPNPNNGSFILDAPQAIGASYTIYDVLGRMIQQGTISTASTLVSISDSAVGVYTLVVHTGASGNAIRFTILK